MNDPADIARLDQLAAACRDTLINTTGPLSTGSPAPDVLTELLRDGASVLLTHVPELAGDVDSNGDVVSEPLGEAYLAMHYDAAGNQIGAGEGASPGEALATIRVQDPAEYGDGPFEEIPPF